jgi:hypothetical protein
VTEQDRPTEATDADEVRDAPQTSNNQARSEPVPPSPAATPPDFAARSEDRPVGVKEAASTRPQPPVPSPGFVSDEHGHVAVSTQAAQGTSEELPNAQAVKTTALAQPGKPDGEVAT